MKRNFTLLTLAALVMVALSTRAPAQSSYTAVDVGLLSGTAYNYPSVISNNPAGVEAAGISMVKSGAQYVMGHAFYWSQATGIVDIGVVGTDISSTVSDINTRGELVGRSYWYHNSGTGRPIYWNVSRGARNPLALPTLGDPRGSTFGINDAGTIVGAASDASGVNHGVVWKKDANGNYGTPTTLLDLAGNPTGFPRAINNAGEITGSGSDSLGNPRACVWVPDAEGNYGMPSALGIPLSDPQNVNDGEFINENTQAIARSDVGFFFCSNGVYTLLLDLNGASTGGSVWPTGLNAAGQTAGYAAAGSAMHAALWQSGAPYDLGTLGGTNSYAYSSIGSKINPVYTGFTINSSGQVVGHSQTTGNKALHAFVWSSSLGMRDLNNLTPSKAGFITLQDGTGINDAGVITGTGVVKTTPIVLTHAYVVFPKP